MVAASLSPASSPPPSRRRRRRLPLTGHFPFPSLTHSPPQSQKAGSFSPADLKQRKRRASQPLLPSSRSAASREGWERRRLGRGEKIHATSASRERIRYGGGARGRGRRSDTAWSEDDDEVPSPHSSLPLPHSSLTLSFVDSVEGSNALEDAAAAEESDSSEALSPRHCRRNSVYCKLNLRLQKPCPQVVIVVVERRSGDACSLRQGPCRRFVEFTQSSFDASRVSLCPADIKNFRVLVNKLCTVDPSLLSNKQKLPFWLKSHNFCVMHETGPTTYRSFCWDILRKGQDAQILILAWL